MTAVEAMAAEVVLLMKSALAPLQQQVAVQAAQIADLQARVQDDSLTKELGSLRERIAVAEVRQLVPGPAGKDGADGFGFDDLSVESDGDRTMALTFVKGECRKSFPVTLPYRKFKGPYQPGQIYQPGDEVLKSNGTTWVVTSLVETGTTPGESKAWTMSGRGSK